MFADGEPCLFAVDAGGDKVGDGVLAHARTEAFDDGVTDDLTGFEGGYSGLGEVLDGAHGKSPGFRGVEG